MGMADAILATTTVNLTWSNVKARAVFTHFSFSMVVEDADVSDTTVRHASYGIGVGSVVGVGKPYKKT